MSDLQECSVRHLFIRGLRKMIIELTSIKFLLLVFIGIITYSQICSDIVGISAMLALVGMREAIGMMANGFIGKNNGSEPSGSPKVPE